VNGNESGGEAREPRRGPRGRWSVVTLDSSARCTRSSDQGAFLPPTMVKGFLAPFMQLLSKRVVNTTPGI
jgi:hypothetical protein